MFMIRSVSSSMFTVIVIIVIVIAILIIIFGRGTFCKAESSDPNRIYGR